MMFLVGLTNSVGGFEKLAPDSSLNDGKFTLLILKKCNIAEFIRIVSLAIRGEHVDDPLVISSKAEKIISHIIGEEVLLNLDGEYGGVLPATFQNLYRHIEMFAPLDELREQDLVLKIKLALVEVVWFST